MLRKWWFWSIVVFVVTEALGLYMVVNYDRDWNWRPFNQSDALATIIFPIVLSIIPLTIRNMRTEGIPRETKRGKLFLSISRVVAVLTLVAFALSFWPVLSEYGFAMFSFCMLGAGTIIVFDTAVARKIEKRPLVQPPKIVRFIFLIIYSIWLVNAIYNFPMWLEQDYEMWVWIAILLVIAGIYELIRRRYHKVNSEKNE